MQDGLYVALSAQIALEKRLTTIADNVANMSTVGFRADRGEVRGRRLRRRRRIRSPSPRPATPISRAQAGRAARDRQSPFDFAVQGDAWFGIDTPAGTVMTRDGRFTMTDTGELDDASKAIPCSTPAARRSSSIPLNGAPEVGARRHDHARTASWSARSACSTSIPARTSTASAIPASSRRRARAGRRPYRTSASCRASSRNRTSIPVLEMTPADHGAARLRERRGADPRHRIDARRSRQDARRQLVGADDLAACR